MTNTRWSLSNRLTWWLSLVTVVPGLIAVVIGGLFLKSSIARELDGLASEETEEALVRLRQAIDPLASFAAISRELGSQHPDTPLGWQVVDRRTGSSRGEFGHTELFAARHSRVVPVDQTVDLGQGRLARSFDAPPDLRVLLIVDGAGRLAFLSNYWLAAGVMIAVSTTIALLASRLLARRVAGLVRQVADDVHASRATQQQPKHRPGSPDEIREVVEALRAEMRRIREETDRARLLTAGLAHELRSPLQNLIGQAEVTLLKPREGPAYAATLASQLEELTELSDAVDNLLTICTAGRAEPGHGVETFDVGAQAALRLQRERARAQREGVDLQMHTVGDTRMAGDRESVLRGIRNVVANAIDWTPRGGEVRVSIDGSQTQLDVVVDDTGPGVPVEVRDRIFEPFFQGPAKDRKRVGYGLGLAMAHAAVDGHGGHIEVATSAMGGAHFRLRFPRDMASRPQAPS